MKDIRNHINHVANQHSEHVDKDVIWAGIEQKMDKHKKRRRFIPFLIWGLGFSIVALSLFGLSKFSATTELSTSKIDLSHSKKVSSEEKNEINSGSEINIQSQVSPIVESRKSASSDDLRTQGKNKTITEEKTNHSITSSLNDKPSINLQTLSDPSSDFLQHKEISSVDNGQLIPEKNEPIILNNNRKFDLFKLSSLQSMVSYIRPKVIINEMTPYPSFLPPSENQSLSFLSTITMHSQYGFGSKSIPGSSQYAINRNDTEELLEQLRFGIESDLITVLDFSFYGGVAFSSINNRVSSFETFYEDRETTYVESYYIDPNGAKVENFTTEDLPHFINNRAVRHNSHRIISMPLGIRFGREVSKINLGVGFGLDFNYHLSATHTIMGSGDKLTSIQVGGQWSSPSFHTAISIDYPITKSWYIHSKLIYRNTTLNYPSIGNDFTENYKIYGIDLGLKIELF